MLVICDINYINDIANGPWSTKTSQDLDKTVSYFSFEKSFADTSPQHAQPTDLRGRLR